MPYLSYLDYVFLGAAAFTWAKHHQQLVVRDKEESWKDAALCFEVSGQGLLTYLETSNDWLQFRHSPWL